MDNRLVFTVNPSKGDFVEKLFKIFLSCSCALLLLASCSANFGQDGGQVQPPLEALSCIAVLPAGTSVDRDDAIDYEEGRDLEKGADFATDVITTELSGNRKVRLLTADQVASMVPDVSGGLSGTVSAIGKKANCDAVLLTTVRRFKQRVGTEFASDDPASAELHMAIMHTRTGAVLWTGDFRETQESFLDNVLSFDKMQKRGFKWVTVEQLVEQAIKERLATCPYLH